MMTSTGTNEELQGPEMWRQQCARNLMDCYALAIESLGNTWERGTAVYKALDALTRLMVDGMTAVRGAEDEKVFYRTAAELCRECGRLVTGRAGMFRIYAEIFGDMAGEEAAHE